MPSSRDLLDDARRVIPEVTPQQVAKEKGSRTLIDVRERDEFEAGHIPGALHLSKGFIEVQIEDRVPGKERPITLYCAGGTRSLLAARALHELGYSDVRSMSGGFNGWKQAGFDFEVPRVLTADQKRRYNRHLLIPEVGEEGQAKLLDAKVLLIGAGGLGSPTALYLAAAGVGTIGIVDHDVVDLSNLQRQILHTNGRVGMPKVESARETLHGLNPDINVIGYQERLSSDNVMR